MFNRREFSQLIIWDKILSNQELQTVSDALNNYLLTGIAPSSSIQAPVAFRNILKDILKDSPM